MNFWTKMEKLYTYQNSVYEKKWKLRKYYLSKNKPQSKIQIHTYRINKKIFLPENYSSIKQSRYTIIVEIAEMCCDWLKDNKLTYFRFRFFIIIYKKFWSLIRNFEFWPNLF